VRPQLAGWWLRVAAYVLDQLILAVPLMLVYFVFLVPVLFAMAQDPSFRSTAPVSTIESQRRAQVVMERMLPAMFGFFAVALVIPVAYFSFFHGWKGQTPGKMAVRIRVVLETGERVTYVRALIRYLVALALWFFFYIPGVVDALFPLFDAKKQTIHDKAAGTVVVRV
jgi:uncharacterized RDD family membrane protein YckC